MNGQIFQNILNERFFQTKFFLKVFISWITDLLNNLFKNSFFYWTNDFIEHTIIRNELFYRTIVQWENEQNMWKKER